MDLDLHRRYPEKRGEIRVNKNDVAFRVRVRVEKWERVEVVPELWRRMEKLWRVLSNAFFHQRFSFSS